VLAQCGSGCADEGIEVIAGSPDASINQLCRPAIPVARPILPGDLGGVEICSEEGTVCVDGIVRYCDRPGQPVRPLARCLYGCQPGFIVDHGETKNPDGIASILCRRDQPERR
jgi:hypothetical protein